MYIYILWTTPIQQSRVVLTAKEKKGKEKLLMYQSITTTVSSTKRKPIQ